MALSERAREFLERTTDMRLASLVQVYKSSPVRPSDWERAPYHFRLVFELGVCRLDGDRIEMVDPVLREVCEFALAHSNDWKPSSNSVDEALSSGTMVPETEADRSGPQFIRDFLLFADLCECEGYTVHLERTSPESVQFNMNTEMPERLWVEFEKFQARYGGGQ